MAKTKQEPEIRVKTTNPFKLKDKQGRNYQVIVLKEFGFTPERLIIEKVYGENNMIKVHAVLTDEEIKKEDKLKVKLGVKT